MTDSKTPPTVPAVPAAELTPEQITEAMVAAGLITPAASGVGINRVRLDGQTFIFGDPKNPDYKFDSPSDGRPAFRCLIASDAIEYNGRWFDDVLAAKVNRPNIAGRMCKTHKDIPSQAYENAEDGTKCNTCPVYFKLPRGTELPTDGKGISKKCGGMLDIEFWLIDADGSISDQRIWTLSTPFSGLMEWQGSWSDRAAGSVTETNFKRKLAILAAQRDPTQIAAAVVQATNALNNGLVVAEARGYRAEREGNRYSVPSFNPIDVIAADQAPALPSSTNEATAAEPDAGSDATPDDIPF